MEHKMKYIISSFILLFLISNIFATNDANIISQSRLIKIMPLYQTWTSDNMTLVSEISIPVFIYMPFGRNMSLSLRGGQATASGDFITNLSGLTDTQLSTSYHLESYNLVLNLGANLPSGKKELNFNEFNTSSFLSLNYFNFLTPNFGQGLNLSPGITWAYPLNDNFVLGLGVSYQMKGKFKPIEGMVADYKPGDEILFTGGIDIRMGEIINLSADLIYITYGSDEISNKEVFASGDMILANVQFRQYLNYNELLLFARYRSKGKNSLAVAGALVPEPQKTTPNQIEIIGNYRYRFTQNIYANVLAEGRFYLKTPVFPGLQIFGFGATSEIKLFSGLTLSPRVKYLIGKFKTGSSITGLEGGLGLIYNF